MSLGSFLAVVPSALKYSCLEGRGSHILVKKDQEVTEFTDPAPRLGKQLQGVQSPRWVGLSDDALQTPNWFTNLDLVESFLGLISALLGGGGGNSLFFPHLPRKITQPSSLLMSPYSHTVRGHQSPEWTCFLPLIPGIYSLKTQ